MEKVRELAGDNSTGHILFRGRIGEKEVHAKAYDRNSTDIIKEMAFMQICKDTYYFELMRDLYGKFFGDIAP